MTSDGKMLHGFVPDPIVENDSSPCEVCGEMFDMHFDYALYVKETDKERARLESSLASKDELLHRAMTALVEPCDGCKQGWAFDQHPDNVGKFLHWEPCKGTTCTNTPGQLHHHWYGCKLTISQRALIKDYESITDRKASDE